MATISVEKTLKLINNFCNENPTWDYSQIIDAVHSLTDLSYEEIEEIWIQETKKLEDSKMKKELPEISEVEVAIQRLLIAHAQKIGTKVIADDDWAPESPSMSMKLANGKVFNVKISYR